MGSGKRAFKVWAFLCVALGVAFVLALRLAVEEREALSELRSQMRVAGPAPSSAAISAASPMEVPAPSGSEAGASASPISPVVPSQHRQAVASGADLDAAQ